MQRNHGLKSRLGAVKHFQKTIIGKIKVATKTNIDYEGQNISGSGIDGNLILLSSRDTRTS
jgi:hypothetical protein